MTPLRSTLKRFTDQLPLLMEDSKPLVMMFMLIFLDMSNCGQTHETCLDGASTARHHCATRGLRGQLQAFAGGAAAAVSAGDLAA